MSIVIYTYSDPYKLDKEPYWDEIKSCPYFCASQTLVNGIKGLYKNDFRQGRITTVQNLIESLFSYWESTACMVKQHTVIDNIITNSVNSILSSELNDNISKAFLFNREEIFKSVRIMFELNMDVQDILLDQLTPEQLFLVDIYKKIISSDKNTDFTLNYEFDQKSINSALDLAMKKGASKEPDWPSIQDDRIVIHGVHQFTPIMLRTIEEISQYKTVVLLFNYQSQYKNVYQTWIDIYAAFDCPISKFSETSFSPSLQHQLSYNGNLLGDSIGKLINGQKKDVVLNGPLEVIEFNNMTEFANYAADIFSVAEKSDPTNPLKKMKEQIYAADNSSNEILKIYFPEQFGERKFLNYPLGHFFIAIANMWSTHENKILITDIKDIKECLSAGILKEQHLGELATIWSKVEALFDGCTTIDEMLHRIKKVMRNQKRITDSQSGSYLSHISYYHLYMDELAKLEKALNELEELANYFYEDFENKSNNFKDFYKRLKGYLQNDVLDAHSLGSEFSDIVRRVLDRLSEVEDLDASASFECLKATMSIYLAQESKPGNSANWIVRNFEQIDGDIIRSIDSKIGGEITTYHFACLSDEDINSVKNSEFPWPLDSDFFEVAQSPVDWKYQVFVKSKKEYKNFKRYALMCGLEFNRAKYKLSYVKRDGDKERNLYYLFRLLGAKVIQYKKTKLSKFLEDTTNINTEGSIISKFDVFDNYRYKICKYRFLMESIIEGTTVYKDNFLLLKYLEVLVENKAKEDLQAFPLSETILSEKLNDSFEEYKKYFPFVLNVHRMDVINNIKRRMTDTKSKSFPILKEEDRQYMKIRELFIHKQLADPKTNRKNVLEGIFPVISANKVQEELSAEVFRKNADIWCQYCSNREICIAYYTELK